MKHRVFNEIRGGELCFVIWCVFCIKIVFMELVQGLIFLLMFNSFLFDVVVLFKSLCLLSFVKEFFHFGYHARKDGMSYKTPCISFIDFFQINEVPWTLGFVVRSYVFFESSIGLHTLCSILAFHFKFAVSTTLSVLSWKL